jgi:hypothetical protein
MKTLETIRVRFYRLGPKEVSEIIARSLGQENAPEQVVCRKFRDGLDTAPAVHVHRSDGGATVADRCALGFRRAAAQREVGAVKHTTRKQLN